MRSSYAYASKKVAALCGALACLCSMTVQAQTFAQPALIPTGNWPVYVTGGDTTGPRPRLFYIDAGATPAISTTHVIQDDGKGNFTPVATIATAGSALGIGDFNQDGIQDVAWVACTTGCSAFYAPGNANGGFGATVLLGTLASGPKTPVAAYLDVVAMNLTQRNLVSLVVADSANNRIFVLDPRQSSTTTQGTPVVGGVGPIAADDADLNGDGNSDLVFAGSVSRQAVILLGNGDGTFMPERSFAGSGEVSASKEIPSLQVNGLDLVCEGANGRIDSYLSNGDGTFSTTPDGTTGPIDARTGVGGKPVGRLVYSDGSGSILYASNPSGISMLVAGPDGLYSLEHIYNAGPGDPPHGLIGDFNGDDAIDLLLTSPEGIAILYGNPDGTLQSSLAFSAGKPAMSAALGAFRTSGHLDAIVSTSAQQAQLLLGQGDGTFQAYPGNAATPQPTTSDTGTPGLWSTVVAADFDGDGKLDFALTADGPNSLIPTAGTGVVSQLGNGDGTFSPSVAPNYSNQHSCVGQEQGALYGTSALAPFLHSPIKNNLAVRSARRQVILNGNSAFPPVLLEPYYESVDLDCLEHPHNLIVAGDFNNDGLPDVINQRDGHLTLGRNEYKAIPFGFYFALSSDPGDDLSIDGGLTTPGQLTAPALSSGFGGTISTADGGFGFPAAMGSAAVADLDGDGNNDLVVVYANLSADRAAPVSTAPNYIYIWFGDGTGHFPVSARHPVNPVRFSPSRNFYQAVLADLNNDGIPDLVLSDEYLLSIQYGKGDGTFGAENHFLAGRGINSISVGDVNGDHVPDLVVANGGTILSNAAANLESLSPNPDVDTGGITVLLNPLGVPPAPPAPKVSPTLTAAPEPSAFEASFTLTANLVPPSGSPTPTGTVTFLITQPAPVGGAAPPPVQQTVTLQNGIATYTVPAVTPATTGTGYLPGRDTLTASYSGDTNYPALPSFTGSHTVQLGVTSVTLTPAPPLNQLLSTYFYGQPVNGYVNFIPQDSRYPVTDTWSQLSNGVVVPGCAAIPAVTTGSCPYGYPQLLDSGTYAFVEAYNGDPINGAAQTTAYNFTIQADTTSASSLTSSLNPAIAGTPVTFTATFTGNFAVPTGSVNFLDNGNLIGSATLDAAGKAAFTTASLAVGTHPISAQYPGNIDFGPAATGTLPQVILPNIPPLPSAITLTSSANPAALGSPVIFTAVVTLPGNPQLIPSGTVSFLDGTQVIGTATLDSLGQASFTTSTLALGSHPITATYPGQPETVSLAAILPAVSPVLNQLIAVPGFVLTLSPTSLNLPAGQTAIVLVTVSQAFGLPGPIALTCSGIPNESSCTFEGAPIPATGGTAALQLTTSAPHPCGDPTHPYVNGTQAHCSGRPNRPSSASGTHALEYSFPALAGLILLIPRRKLLRLRLRTPLLALALLACLTALNACGGTCTDLGTRLQSYTVTVTATPPPGSVPAQSASLHLKVIPQ